MSDTGLKLPVVDGGRELEEDPNGEKASSKVERGSVVVGVTTLQCRIRLSEYLRAGFLHLAKGLNRLVHCREEAARNRRRRQMNERTSTK